MDLFNATRAAAQAEVGHSADVLCAAIYCPEVFRVFVGDLTGWVRCNGGDTNQGVITFNKAIDAEEEFAAVAGELNALVNIGANQGGLVGRAIVVGFCARYGKAVQQLTQCQALKSFVSPAVFDTAVYGEFIRLASGKRSEVYRCALHPSELACKILQCTAEHCPKTQ